MFQDRFVKGMLVVIAALLAANLLRPADHAPAFLESTARAQDVTATAPGSQTRVTAVGGFRVSDLKQVVAVGDGKSFIVSNPTGFQVYRVDDIATLRR